MIELHALASGEVQGVGFRETVKKYALRAHLRGFVRNLEDGRVEFVVQGKKEDIVALLASLEETFKLDHVELKWREARQPFSTFEILG